MHRRFRNADHRPLRQLARGQQSRIAETGDHMTVNALPSPRPHLFQHADRRDGFVKVPFNGRHPSRGHTARISVPGAAAVRAAAAMVSVIA